MLTESHQNLKTNLQFSYLTGLQALLLLCNTYAEKEYVYIKKRSLPLSDQIYYLSWSWEGFQTKDGKLEKIHKIYEEKNTASFHLCKLKPHSEKARS